MDEMGCLYCDYCHLWNQFEPVNIPKIGRLSDVYFDGRLVVCAIRGTSLIKTMVIADGSFIFGAMQISLYSYS